MYFFVTAATIKSVVWSHLDTIENNIQRIHKNDTREFIKYFKMSQSFQTVKEENNTKKIVVL